MSGRLGASLLVFLALLAMGLATGEWLLLAPLAALLAGAAFVRIEGAIPFRTYMVLGVPFALLARLHPVEGSSGLGLNIPFYVALYMQLLAIRKMATNSPDFSQVIFFAACGVASVGADCLQEKAGRYHLLALGFAGPLVLAIRGGLARRVAAKRRLPGAGLVVATLLVLAFAEGSARVIEHYYEDVNQAFMRRIMKTPLPAAGGFSGAARLGSVSGLQAGDEADTVALRAFARFAPGYLRGKTFRDYEKGEWTAEPDAVLARPSPVAEDSKVGRLVLPGRREPASEEAPAARISPASGYGRHFFLPLRTTAIETTSETVNVAPGGSIESPFDSTASGYSAFTGREPVMGAGSTRVPADPALLAALDAVLAGIGPAEKPAGLVRALRDYFAKKYTYKFGIELDKGSDPLVQFLTTKTHGHCELFASAGTLLLRRRGVPARYTTGFLCLEKNPRSEDLWVARNRHGHAWVEFFDPEAGWETAELTPDTGMPRFEPPSGLAAWLEALAGLKDRFLAQVAERGVLGVLLQALRGGGAWLVGSWPGRGLLVVLAGYVLLRGAKRLPRKAPRARERILPAALEAERQRYRALERALARQGFTRAATETLEEFAARVPEEAAVQVRAYAARRYAPFV